MSAPDPAALVLHRLEDAVRRAREMAYYGRVDAAERHRLFMEARRLDDVARRLRVGLVVVERVEAVCDGVASC